MNCTFLKTYDAGVSNKHNRNRVLEGHLLVMKIPPPAFLRWATSSVIEEKKEVPYLEYRKVALYFRVLPVMFYGFFSSQRSITRFKMYALANSLTTKGQNRLTRSLPNIVSVLPELFLRS